MTTGVTVSLTCAASVACAFRPENGGVPVSISYAIAPSA